MIKWMWSFFKKKLKNINPNKTKLFYEKQNDKNILLCIYNNTISPFFSRVQVLQKNNYLLIDIFKKREKRELKSSIVL